MKCVWVFVATSTAVIPRALLVLEDDDDALAGIGNATIKTAQGERPAGG